MKNQEEMKGQLDEVKKKAVHKHLVHFKNVQEYLKEDAIEMEKAILLLKKMQDKKVKSKETSPETRGRTIADVSKIINGGCG